MSSNHGRRSGSYSATILQKCGGTVGVQILDFLALGSLRIGLVTIDYLPTTLAPAVFLVNVDVTNIMLRLSWRLDLLTHRFPLGQMDLHFWISELSSIYCRLGLNSASSASKACSIRIEML